MSNKPLSPLEHNKANSRFLRGTIDLGLADPSTGAISEPDTKLLKFHGSYQQDHRDLRDERRRQKLEPDFSFMVRVRLPGGVLRRRSGWRWTIWRTATPPAGCASPRARPSSTTAWSRRTCAR